MTISVIIPTYNRAHHLERAISSVLNQTARADEVIIVDDGSSDSTRTLIQQRFPECIYLYQANQGVSSARNLGIRHAKGEWLAFLDSDDEWLPTKLASQIETLKRSPNLPLCHTEEIWVRNGIRVNAMRKHAKSGGRIFQRCLPLCVISPSAAMLHQRIFTEVGLFDESLPACEDYDLWLRICARHPVAFVESPQIVKYGGHEDQLSHQHWGMDRFRILALEKIITSGQIQGDDLQAANKMLIKKAGILAAGAGKRGKPEQEAHYLALQRQYSTGENDAPA